MKNAVIVVAAGKGKRFGSRVPKQFLKTRNREIVAACLDNFERSRLIDSIVLVVSKEMRNYACAMVKKYGYNKISAVIDGGAERFHSVYNAVNFLRGLKPVNVLIQDGARPRVSAGIIEKVIKALKKEKAVIPVNRIYATVKQVKAGYIEKTLDRDMLRTAHTPQGFRFKELAELYDLKKLESHRPTDDASVFEAAGYKVKIIEDGEENIKVTVKGDLKKIKSRV
jgi:2-C-methyl-D-erythritol 4-phosphate cytidylyltransferase